MEQHKLDVFDTGGLDERSKAYLLETTRWTKFLAIMGFIFVGLMIIIALVLLVAGSALSAYSGSGLAVLGATGGSIVMLVIIALYVYPIYALWKFSTNMKSGINTANQEQIIEGFRYQKNMYRFMGILMIIVLAFYLLTIIASVF
ncbi:hypothetical protein [Taibaiella chishuiensis]|uniref:Uncharacterized protein n=1 Tax=Taibaiella chishuiensis TaxID=1434707 RepID=A0A2P8D3Z3_9BACT|nr:hypothetical protein [Taibaiella chishuiensis]PSK91933.1 hypothetical protein B0I18_10427 [Taibaiella chishuiensis]